MRLNPTQFTQLADSAFLGHFSHTGFQPAGQNNHDHWYCSRIYRFGNQYVKFSAGCHPRDGAPECHVILGEGSTDFPEYDWNSITLWRLRGENGKYSLDSVDSLNKVLPMMCSDLAEHASDFLSGDLYRFRKIRAL